MAPVDAVTLIDENFAENLLLTSEAAGASHRELARLGVSGGAIYDGLVALAARQYDAVLVTRDARARSTYEAVGAHVRLLARAPDSQ